MERTLHKELSSLWTEPGSQLACRYSQEVELEPGWKEKGGEESRNREEREGRRTQREGGERAFIHYRKLTITMGVGP